MDTRGSWVGSRRAGRSYRVGSMRIGHDAEDRQIGSATKTRVIASANADPYATIVSATRRSAARSAPSATDSVEPSEPKLRIPAMPNATQNRRRTCSSEMIAPASGGNTTRRRSWRRVDHDQQHRDHGRNGERRDSAAAPTGDLLRPDVAGPRTVGSLLVIDVLDLHESSWYMVLGLLPTSVIRSCARVWMSVVRSIRPATAWVPRCPYTAD